MSDGGKGSKARPLSVSQAEYESRWDAIFGRDQVEQPQVKTWPTMRDNLQPAPVQEPHSWYSAEHDEWMTNKTRKEHEALNSYTHKVGGFDLALYTTPPAAQRQWVGLTDEEVRETISSVHIEPLFSYRHVARAIEAKLREKNGGQA